MVLEAKKQRGKTNLVSPVWSHVYLFWEKRFEILIDDVAARIRRHRRRWWHGKSKRHDDAATQRDDDERESELRKWRRRRGGDDMVNLEKRRRKEEGSRNAVFEIRLWPRRTVVAAIAGGGLNLGREKYDVEGA